MRLPPSLRAPQYRLYAGGNLFALQGMWAQRTVIAWLAWDLTESASWVGVIAFLSFAPTLISGPVFGVFADQTDLRRAIVAVEIAFTVIAVALFVLLISGALSIWGLAAIALMIGLAISAHHPVRLALIPRLAPREVLPNAIAMSSLNFNLARLTAPAWAGYAITALGTEATAAICALLFGPVVFAYARLKPRELDGGPAPRQGFLASLKEGAAYAWRTPMIRLALLLTTVFALLVRGFLEVLPVVADGVFARGAAGLGALMAAVGGGALAAAALLASRDLVTTPEPPRATLIAIFAGYGSLMALAVTPWWPLVLLLSGLAGFTGTMVGVTMQSVVQLALEDGKRGRVMSLWITVGIGAAALGAIGLGALMDAIGYRATLLWCPPFAAAATMTVFALAGGVRRAA